METGLSDHPKFIATFVKSHFTKLNPKTVYYRDFKNFDENSFLNDLRETNFDLSTNNPNEPLKNRFVRGN